MRDALILGAVTSAILLATTASAEEAKPRVEPGSALTDPIWQSRPTARDVSEVYPQKAMARMVIGIAVMRCTAGPDGRLNACAIDCEGPQGWGFGAALLKLAGSFRMRPTLADGRSVEGGIVRLPAHFNPPGLGPYTKCEPTSATP